MKTIYLIGSLRNERVPIVAHQLRYANPDDVNVQTFDVFDDWYAAGPEADDYWKRYEQGREHTYAQALQGHAAVDVFEFDQRNIHRSDIGVLLLPAGKSGHLEFGYMCGQEKPGYILFDEGEPEERWDVMYQYASQVFYDVASLRLHLVQTHV